jgi:hypothetical protein
MIGPLTTYIVNPTPGSGRQHHHQDSHTQYTKRWITSAVYTALYPRRQKYPGERTTNAVTPSKSLKDVCRNAITIKCLVASGKEYIKNKLYKHDLKVDKNIPKIPRVLLY